MSNRYSNNFSVCYVAKLFKVDTSTVKTWAKTFAEYLSNGANPVKGNQRYFNLDDVRVMAYIYYYWEDQPDLEHIKIGLNSNSHYDHELIDDLILKISPFIFYYHDKVDESWKHGVLFSGLSEFSDTFYLANSYKLAGDQLIDIALKNEAPWDLFCPAVYNYRHATELYLKSVFGSAKQTHNLKTLFEKFKKSIKEKYDQDCPDWFTNIILTFDTFDPYGTTFRYGGDINSSEVFVDFIQMKTAMGWMADSFRNIRRHQDLPDV
ncbi:MerR family transcriptional regulator [Sphingobacterium chuzhouense]|uniref:MerR family transcriptional regulator n=1 Tax=Sphingobacterium chuzhouense TaxID=1742264 RepID=A0ABR7XN54_9SPHI|nr:MerR family transcriptional regulator [Sphingobacterium chuzhouense]MBD1419959.1 MerR family transcriptional regulator [Sphingobacterium chuzhouense]